MSFRLRKTTLGLALALLMAAGLSAVYAAGIYPGFPNYGTAGSTTLYNGSTTFATGVTPTISGGVTGNEVAAFDTGLAGGVQPQTVNLTTSSLGAGAVQYAIPVTGNTVNIANGAGAVIIEPAGTLATLTVVLPTLPVDSQTVRVTSTQTLTALSVTATGGPSGVTIAGTAVTALTPSATAAVGYEYIYRTNTNKWYRVQ